MCYCELGKKRFKEKTSFYLYLCSTVMQRMLRKYQEIISEVPYVYLKPRKYDTARKQVYSTHWSTRVTHKVFCEAQRVTRV